MQFIIVAFILLFLFLGCACFRESFAVQTIDFPAGLSVKHEKVTDAVGREFPLNAGINALIVNEFGQVLRREVFYTAKYTGDPVTESKYAIDSINFWRKFPQPGAKYIVLISHGNAVDSSILRRGLSGYVDQKEFHLDGKISTVLKI